MTWAACGEPITTAAGCSPTATVTRRPTTACLSRSFAAAAAVAGIRQRVTPHALRHLTTPTRASLHGLLDDILACRTEALGSQLWRCETWCQRRGVLLSFLWRSQLPKVPHRPDPGVTRTPSGRDAAGAVLPHHRHRARRAARCAAYPSARRLCRADAGQRRGTASSSTCCRAASARFAISACGIPNDQLAIWDVIARWRLCEGARRGIAIFWIFRPRPSHYFRACRARRARSHPVSMAVAYHLVWVRRRAPAPFVSFRDWPARSGSLCRG
jgi:hypothetical protein